MLSKNRILHTQKGSALLITCVLCLVCSLIGLFSLSYMHSMSSSFQRSKIVSGESLLELRLRREIRYAPMFYQSIYSTENKTVNQMLKNCLFDDSLFDGSSADCDSTKWYPVELYSDDDVATKKIVRIAAPAQPQNAAQGIPYGLNAQICDVASASCPYMVTADFKAQCKDDTPNCKIAENITTRFTIKAFQTSISMRDRVITQTRIVYDGSADSMSRPGKEEPPPPPPPVIPIQAGNQSGPGQGSSNDVDTGNNNANPGGSGSNSSNSGGGSSGGSGGSNSSSNNNAGNSNGVSGGSGNSGSGSAVIPPAVTTNTRNFKRCGRGQLARSKRCNSFTL